MGSDTAEIVRISEPIKAFWAKEKHLNLKELMSDGPYKEMYRKQMIIWSDEMRSEDYGIFCREATKNGWFFRILISIFLLYEVLVPLSVSKPIVIVSDIRRKTDIKFFQENFPNKIKLIRIKCDDHVRISRGWKFQEGVDDIQSECDLDDFTEWDLVLENDGSQQVDAIVEEIVGKFTDKRQF